MGATDRAVGGIRTQFSTEVYIRLAQASIDVWESIEEEFGVDIEYRRSGYLYVAREKSTVDLFREMIPLQNDHSVPSEFLPPRRRANTSPRSTSRR